MNNYYHPFIISYTHYEYEYSDYPVNTHINQSISNDSICFVQSLAGLKTKIEFPDMKEYFSEYDKVVINKAELNVNEYTPLILSTKCSPSWIWGTFESNSYEQLTEEFYHYVDISQNGIYIDTLNQYTFNLSQLSILEYAILETNLILSDS